jgi:glycosyltransferase involved in cell wall biosynthesis
VDDLHQALTELLGDPAARGRLGDAALRAAAGPYSWDAVAERTLRLYQSLLER